jgi:hypothetical protein
MLTDQCIEEATIHISLTEPYARWKIARAIEALMCNNLGRQRIPIPVADKGQEAVGAIVRKTQNSV